MSGGSNHTGAIDNRHELEVRAIGSEGEFMIDLFRDELWLYRTDGFEIGPRKEPGALLYNCDGPPNTLVDLALGKDVQNCSPGELAARAVEITDAAYRSARSGQLETVRQ
jgi:predicted dehydrogenase